MCCVRTCDYFILLQRVTSAVLSCPVCQPTWSLLGISHYVTHAESMIKQMIHTSEHRTTAVCYITRRMLRYTQRSQAKPGELATLAILLTISNQSDFQ